MALCEMDPEIKRLIDITCGDQQTDVLASWKCQIIGEYVWCYDVSKRDCM